MAATDIPDRIVGFHAQQAVELFLKAVLSLDGTGYERTHDLERLATLWSVVAMVYPRQSMRSASSLPGPWNAVMATPSTRNRSTGPE